MKYLSLQISLMGFALSLSVHGQLNCERPFRLLKCPQSAGVIVSDFNLQYGSLQSVADYENQLKVTFAKVEGGEVKYLHCPPNDKPTVYYYFPSKSISRGVGLQSLASKGFEKNLVSSTRDFKTTFSDTIVILNALKQQVRIRELENGGFILQIQKEDGWQQVKLQSIRDTLVIPAQLPGVEKGKYFDAQLYHRSREKRPLASFVLFTPDTLQMEYILSELAELKSDLSITDMNEFEAISNDFLRVHFGHVHPEEIRELVRLSFQ